MLAKSLVVLLTGCCLVGVFTYLAVNKVSTDHWLPEFFTDAAPSTDKQPAGLGRVTLLAVSMVLGIFAGRLYSRLENVPMNSAVSIVHWHVLQPRVQSAREDPKNHTDCQESYAAKSRWLLVSRGCGICEELRQPVICADLVDCKVCEDSN